MYYNLCIHELERRIIELARVESSKALIPVPYFVYVSIYLNVNICIS